MSIFLEKWLEEEVCFHVKGQLKLIVVDLKLIVGVLAFGKCIGIASVRRHQGAKGILVRIFLTAQKDRMLEKMSQAWAMRWVIEATCTHHNGA